MSRLDTLEERGSRSAASSEPKVTETWLETRVRPSNAESHVRELLSEGFTGSITLHCSQGRVSMVEVRQRSICITTP